MEAYTPLDNSSIGLFSGRAYLSPLEAPLLCPLAYRASHPPSRVSDRYLLPLYCLFVGDVGTNARISYRTRRYINKR